MENIPKTLSVNLLQTILLPNYVLRLTKIAVGECDIKGPFIASESELESEKHQETNERDQRKDFKCQRKCSHSLTFSVPLSFGVNGS